MMASLDRVIFGIAGKRVETLYDRRHLRLGAIVYVKLSGPQEPVGFSHQPSKGAIEYTVIWIATSEWYVEITPQFTLRPNFAERLQKEAGDYISRAEIDVALDVFVQMVRMDRFYQTAELGNNPLSVIFTVLERLDDCRRLRKIAPFPPEMNPYLDDPLVSYLYLTCFDRLGQPTNWLDFGAWLQSSDSKEERDAILQEASKAANLLDSIRLVSLHYTTMYGVRSAFMRFLRDILPTGIRRQLLESIDRTIMDNPPHAGSRQASDQEKEKYLFERRNDYTHKANFRPPVGEWFAAGVTNVVQEHHANCWISTQTHDWPGILEKTVQVGLACYIRARSK
jgi:hypothetical protein